MDPRNTDPAEESGLVWAILDRLLPYLDDLGAVVLAVAAALTLLGWFGLTRGVVLDLWVGLLSRWLGLGVPLVPLTLAAGALVLIRRSFGRPWQVRWVPIISAEIAAFSLLGLLSVLDGISLPAAEQGYGGGVVGWSLATLLARSISPAGAGAVLGILAFAAGMYALQGLMGGAEMLNRLVIWLERPSAAPTHAKEHRSSPPPSLLSPPEQGGRRRTQRVPSEFRKNFQLPEVPDERPPRPVRRDSNLPDIGILEVGESSRVSAKEINRAAGLIEKTLADFGLPVRVVDFRTGPSVTQFAVEPGYLEQVGSDGMIKRHKVRVSQISGLANDLALSLSAPRLRIEAPVPGQAYVGVEVPNRRPAVVRLRPILESVAFADIGSPLAVALGRDVAGVATAADLAAMPHLLIAGTTGSGKSVGITSMATCLVMNNAPDDLRLVMIDPKMVELVRFNGLPHLFGKVETDLVRIVGVLRWCTAEMDRRYRLLEKARARDIEAFNRRARRTGEEHLPRVVVMIDELADLMMMAPDQTEQTLVRLAQMARAVGIHLVVATQRPSTDIVTGLIKANFPARMSFATASSTDSRVILDTPGAETLLGRGDMLYLAAEASTPVRLQGVFVSDSEVERVIAFWRNETGEGDEEDAGAPWENLLVKQAVLEEHDDIIEKAIEVVKTEGEASASLLQRRLRIGYPRAARLMDELEELGVVGRAQSGGKTREVLVDPGDDPLLPADDEET